MVTQAARSLIRPWQCGQYGSTDCFFTLRGQSRSCCVGRRPRLEARESSQDPGLAGRGGEADREGFQEETSTAKVGNINRGSDGTATECL